MNTIAQQTLASIVTNNHSTVPVLEKYDLDFCCKGKRTLAEACNEKGLLVETISAELERSTEVQNNKMPFTEMNTEQLISYILIHHHFYVSQSIPTMLGHLEKVAAKHGGRYPYMIEVLYLFKEISKEMTAHMQKEEMVLFPRIKELAAFSEIHHGRKFTEGFINAPIQLMEQEHEHVGNLLYKIRQLTNTYSPPEDACTTFKVSLAALKEFEEDLHKHVHLENNLLFPLAEKLFNKQAQLN